MDAPHRGALMLVRFIAVALIGLSVIILSLSWVQSSMHHLPMRVIDFVLPSVLLVLGMVFLIKADALATWIANKLDE
jgi:protein-S-isoprenylcysteine O-methyltransferase Ste14